MPSENSRSVDVDTDAPVLRVTGVRKAFAKPDGGELLVLEGIDLDLSEGEIVGVLGRSGSGKSTLLLLIAGLAAPNAGSVTYLGQPVVGPAHGIAMVFQSFAIFPWLTVFQNVALGLEARHQPGDHLGPEHRMRLVECGEAEWAAADRRAVGGHREQIRRAKAIEHVLRHEAERRAQRGG